MQARSVFLGAVVAAICGGATLGTSTPTNPISRYSDTFAMVPGHAPQTVSAEKARSMVASRDQYPLQTRKGVIPVQELAYHGRLRSRLREQPLYGAQNEAEAFGQESEYQSVVNASLHEHEKAPVEIMPTNVVPIEEGIFENAAAAGQIHATQAEANTQPHNRIAQGAARPVKVQQEITPLK